MSLRIKRFVSTFIYQNWQAIWDKHILPKILPLLLGTVMSLILAYFIVSETWHLIGVLLFSVPAVIILLEYPFIAVIIWFLVTPFFAIAPNSATRMIYWILHRGLPPAALGATVLSRWLGSNKGHPLPLDRADLAMAAFLGIVSANILLLSPGRDRFILFYDRTLISFCIYWLVRFASPNRKDFKLLLWAALILAIGESLVGLASQFAPSLLSGTGWIAKSRTVGTFREPAEYSSMLAFCSYLALHWAMNHESGVVRNLFMASFGLAQLMTWLTFSRGSWLAAVVGGLGLLLVYPKIARVFIIAALGMMLIGVTVFVDQITFSSERTNTDHTVDNRIVVIYASISMIKEKPFWGWGYENFDHYKNDFIDRSATGLSTEQAIMITSHNTYLTLMAELGLIAFFLYIFPFIWWWRYTLKALPLMPRRGFYGRPLLIILWLIILAQFISGNFLDLRVSPYALSLWWMTLALLANIITEIVKPGNASVANQTRSTTLLEPPNRTIQI